MADCLGYVPNHYARSLKSKYTKTIGVIVPNVVDDFFGKLLHGIEKEASKHGFTVLITFSNDRKKRNKEPIKFGQPLCGRDTDFFFKGDPKIGGLYCHKKDYGSQGPDSDVR